MGAKGRLRSRHFDNIEILDLNDGVSSDLHFYDMKSFNKSFHSYHRHTVHGYHHRKGSSISHNSRDINLSRSSLSEMRTSPNTHSANNRSPFIHHATSLSIQSTEDVHDHNSRNSYTDLDRLGATPSPLLQSQSSPNMHPKIGHITSSAAPTTVVKQKSWNRKDCGFRIAQSIQIPQFIIAIKPSLFERNHHYDVVFKLGGERVSSNGPKQWSNEAFALIIDSNAFDHHYSDRYAFKFRHIRLQSHLKRQQSLNVVHHRGTKSNSVIWNSVESGLSTTRCRQILWIANTGHCECYMVPEEGEDDGKGEWQTFPNLQDNDTHFKIQNYLNVRADTANCDYSLISRV